jgi:hypothetical protein
MAMHLLEKFSPAPAYEWGIMRGTDFGRTHSQFYLASLGATHKGALIAALVPITSLSIILKIPKF